MGCDVADHTVRCARPLHEGHGDVIDVTVGWVRRGLRDHLVNGRIMATSRRSRNWCFTLNNWVDSEYASVLNVLREARYGIVGKETGESGTPHLQGYVCFPSGKTMSAVKRILGQRCHLEIARGMPSSNRTYCSKEGSFEEFGDLPQDPRQSGERERERWIAARAAARTGDFDAIDADIYVRHYSTLKRIAFDHMPRVEDLEAPCGLWWYGDPGTGKSLTARRTYPNLFPKAQNKWWDGYSGEDVVLIDDLDSPAMGHLLKIWLDAYAFVAEVKGGSRRIRPRQIVITSNYSPEELWPDDSQVAAAVRRRCEFRRFVLLGQG